MSKQFLLVAFFLILKIWAYQTKTSSDTGIYIDYITIYRADPLGPSNQQYSHTFGNPLANPPAVAFIINSIYENSHQMNDTDLFFYLFMTTQSATDINFEFTINIYHSSRYFIIRYAVLYCDESKVGSIIIGNINLDCYEDQNQYVAIGHNLQNKTIICYMQYYDFRHIRKEDNKFGYSCQRNISQPTTLNIKLDLEFYRQAGWSILYLVTSWFIIDKMTLYPTIVQEGIFSSHDWTVETSIPTSIFDPVLDQMDHFLLYLTNSSFQFRFFNVFPEANLLTITNYSMYNYLYFNTLLFKINNPIQLQTLQYNYKNLTFSIIVANVGLAIVDTSMFTITSTPTSLITLTNASLNNLTSLLLEFKFNSTSVELANLTIQFEWVQYERQHKSTTNIENVENPLFPSDVQGKCIVMQFKSYYNTRSSLISSIVFYLQFVYLFMFFTSLINSKMIAVEMIFFLQLSYLCLAPVSNPHMKGLSRMKYVNGFNPLFKQLPQGEISQNYAELGFSFNFLSNCNLMIAVVIIPIIVSSFLFLCHHYNNHYRTKPALLKHAKSLLLQWPIVLILFSLPNVIVSFIINLKSLEAQFIISLLIGFIVMVLPVVIAVLHIFHKNKLVEFNQQFHDSTCIKPFSIDASRLICKTYFVVFIAEMYLSIIVLTVQAFQQYSLYIVLLLNVLFGSYYIFIRPYSDRVNNIRLITQRVLFVAQLSVLIAPSLFLSRSLQCSSSNINLLFPYGYITILSIALISNTIVIVLRLMDWVKTGTKIDQELFNKQKSKKQKPRKSSFDPDKSMKRSQHSIGQREIQDLVCQTGRSKKEVMSMLSQFKQKMLIVKESESGYY